MKVGGALKYYRRIGNKTQVQVAEQANINEKYYGELERDESSPTIDRLEKISYALGVELQQIVSYKPLQEVRIEMFSDITMDKYLCNAYCNCCGTEFYALDSVICPVCGCEYSDENEYIEIYG
ncbi:helix-turn-helix domain-containing protein [Coprococcus sp. AF21-14LB]|uniref:helix-turn-helix domain-containing protein n=1 Tax=Coprococcus sp. AF21-14LB TaxID=2292231 RepID=UPI000E4A441C|nr:helix-turn-helix transcriptional regulator [Coprococcus sp. AF21-14LB]RGS77016.1 XRE family transcriptional regulator [Coprococcus sp. AF21-14LB]